MRNIKDIAILMSVYNGELYLREQLDSIINQTFDNWTLYIRDDCSTDSSLSIIKEYLKYPNITLFNDDLGNIGAKNSFFQLLKNIDSQYYMFSDQDDIWLPNKIQVSFERLKDEEAKSGKLCPILVCTDVYITNAKLDIIEESEWRLVGINDNSFSSHIKMLVNPIVIGMTMCFNQLIKDNAFPINSNIGMHDSWLAYIAAKYGKIVNINKQLVLYRQHGNNVCGINNRRKLGLLYKVLHPKSSLQINLDKYNRIKKIESISFITYLYYKFCIIIQRKINKLKCNL